MNGDGRLSHQEFKECMSPWLSDDAVLKQLDAKGDGTLNSYKALTLFYMEKKVSICTCACCGDLLVGPYFSCILCLSEVPNTFDLCCNCYRDKKMEHKHSSENFLDHHSLLMLFRDRLTDEQKNQRKREMDELREIALSHYQASSEEVQQLAHDFFNSMDSDGDGRIDLPEFLEFMRQEGHSRMNNPYFFKEVDRDGNGNLDFWEVMTLYYIITSGRPFCNFCGIFVPGIFFSCVECYKGPENSFNLCPDCHRSRKCIHNHDGRSQFLDNYTLLEIKRDSAKKNKPSSKANSLTASASKLNKWKVALKAFEVGMAIGSISTTLCTIL